MGTVTRRYTPFRMKHRMERENRGRGNGGKSTKKTNALATNLPTTEGDHQQLKNAKIPLSFVGYSGTGGGGTCRDDVGGGISYDNLKKRGEEDKLGHGGVKMEPPDDRTA